MIKVLLTTRISIIYCLINRKKVALYKLTGVANGGNVLWGPKTVICKSLKSGLDYCKLTIQVQYITYRDSISQPIVDPNNLPAFQQILFKINRVVLSV